ncbi:hypothetical protein IWW34DRAFT_665008 [Fusarium oxysporum f. sp. albedinis]|nr:hypothetical protein IWW34DRAFT_665008 [Fusarium oxysporum f. sp. albedinis]KAJ0148009.1 hypothetical protein HZ326_9345 [Fusarium oxysporum f. sp. albedinis]KAK2475778.1 hypothetical protein H9L39_13371 [Fusarium oxysporum f. sp. albedinis]
MHSLAKHKTRQGTHSCWECRRRKVRCRFSSSDDPACIPCRSRGSVCRSQELDDPQEAAQLSIRQLAQRLSSVEDMMKSLAQQVTTTTRYSVPSISTLSAEYAYQTDRTMRQGPTAIWPTSPGAHPAMSHIVEVNKALYESFPSPSDINAIVNSSAGPGYVTTLFHCHADIVKGKSEPPAAVSSIPSAENSPVMLARRLLQLAICMQQLSPHFDASRLSLRGSIEANMSFIVNNVDQHVTVKDDMVASLAGLECLLLLGYWHSNAGNLRRAWLIFRRALSISQLLGLDRLTTAGSPEIHTGEDSPGAFLPSPKMLYYRAVSNDRRLCLFLGFVPDHKDNSFVSPKATETDEDWEKLDKLHTIISARVMNRTSMDAAQAYTHTREASLDMHDGAALLGQSWWNLPILNPEASPIDLAPLIGRLLLQMNHHLLLILLHVPYIINSTVEGSEYSRRTCMNSSREVLERYVAYRQINDSIFSCRHVDYTALLAAISLLVAYVPQQATVADQTLVMKADKELIVEVKRRMEHVASLNSDDGLPMESSAIITKLLPLLGPDQNADTYSEEYIYSSIQLNVPFFGRLRINKRPMSQTARIKPDTIPLVSSDEGDGTRQIETLEDPGLPALQFEPQDELIGFAPLAGPEDWTLQGVDAAYWSLFQN